MSWPYTSAKEINKITDSRKDKNSNGYDEISTKIMKISKSGENKIKISTKIIKKANITRGCVM